MLNFIVRFARRSAQLILGIVVGLALLEGTLRLNPTLLVRGIGIAATVDQPITSQQYDVRYSDADVFYWIASQIQPIPPEKDLIEAHVEYEVDEFGFPNLAGAPDHPDVAIFARSYAQGAQVQTSWARHLQEDNGWQVLNLAQPGAGINLKMEIYQRYALTLHPRWLVIEVLPSLDIMGYASTDPLLIQRMVVPVIQAFARPSGVPSNGKSTTPIYPLATSVHGHAYALTMYPFDLFALTATRQNVEQSNSWYIFRADLLKFVKLAQEQGSCVALLYSPTKPSVFLPLLDDVTALNPVLTDSWVWKLNNAGDLVQDKSERPDFKVMAQNGADMRALLAQTTAELGITFVDPAEAMSAAILNGSNAFMEYDTHWSAAGHGIVADQVTQTLQTAPCGN
ncbi:MAG: hypothetical protein U0528_02595 [Anaerolineae bacterium]